MTYQLRRDNAYICIKSACVDKGMNYEAQVSAICESSFFHVRNDLLSETYHSVNSVETLLHAFITCNLV